MQSLEQSLQRILDALPAPGTETVPLARAAGRILARDAVATVDLPGFDNSAMDGYAVRAADVASAAATTPVRLRLHGQVAAGEVFAGALPTGACLRLFTGSPLPRGADAVVMQEDTRSDPQRPGDIEFLDRVRPWENVRLQGEDLKRGTRSVVAGTRLSAGALGLLAATGVRAVAVGRQPVIGLLATGSELLEPGRDLSPGKIYESNRIALTALAVDAGGAPVSYPLVADTPADTRAALEKALAETDLVVTSGGVSVGEFDHVKSAFEALGGKLEFWRVAIKPGKPFVFGTWRGKFLFGLPGNPVSALVTFLVLVRPALLRWQGASQIQLPAHPATLAAPLVNGGDRRHFMRVKVDPTGQVQSAGVQASHILNSMAEANALIDVPPETTLTAGQTVNVLRFA
jgi:molybdopterin molybdotransferase